MIISASHDQWADFCEKLEERLDFQDNDGKFTWVCGLDGDRLGKAKLVAREMGFEDVQTRFCCDCEIIFNEAPEE